MEDKNKMMSNASHSENRVLLSMRARLLLELRQVPRIHVCVYACVRVR